MIYLYDKKIDSTYDEHIKKRIIPKVTLNLSFANFTRKVSIEIKLKGNNFDHYSQ